jgi:hypothetical protein
MEVVGTPVNYTASHGVPTNSAGASVRSMAAVTRAGHETAPKERSFGAVTVVILFYRR